MTHQGIDSLALFPILAFYGSEGYPGLVSGVSNVPALGLVSRQVVIHRGPTVKVQQCVLCDTLELWLF